MRASRTLSLPGEIRHAENGTPMLEGKQMPPDLPPKLLGDYPPLGVESTEMLAIATYGL